MDERICNALTLFKRRGKMKTPGFLCFGVAVMALLIAGMAMPAQAAQEGMSPALCGANDNPEPGIQGDVPSGATPNYNCGVTLRGSLPLGGSVQGYGDYAYVRTLTEILVIDVSDPDNPKQVNSVKTYDLSETFRVVVNDERAVMVSGSGVYDISNPAKPVLKGKIRWPKGLTIRDIYPTGPPHDLRINRAGTKVYASFGFFEVDITDLDRPRTWRVKDHSCDVAAQFHPLHQLLYDYGVNFCKEFGFSLFPQLSHAPDVNANDTLVYVGDQAGGSNAKFEPVSHVRIIDVTQQPPQIVGEVRGPGHGLDYFRTADNREFVLQSNEIGYGDTCLPYDGDQEEKGRKTALGWGYEVLVSEVTVPQQAENTTMLTIAINDPEFCTERKQSRHNPTVSYHMVDNALDAKFAAVSFGTAGLRIYDIRNPNKNSRPPEVAYFNHEMLSHAGVCHYDARRHLLYVPGTKNFMVLEIQPQVLERLGM